MSVACESGKLISVSDALQLTPDGETHPFSGTVRVVQSVDGIQGVMDTVDGVRLLIQRDTQISVEPDRMLLRQHVDDICAVSPFFDAEEYYPYSLSGKLNEYLAASRARMEVLFSKFEEMGYTGEVHPWSYYKHPCYNVIFRQGEERDHETWIVAHHDYCAGQGADDNASALSVMVETAREIKGSGLPVTFASFDLEERGLLGAKNYADSFSSMFLRQRIAQMIDLECLGSAPDLFLVDHGHEVISDPCLNERIASIAQHLDIPLYEGDHRLSFADHVPFAKKGIPTAQLCALDIAKWRRWKDRDCHPKKFGGILHSNADIPANVSIENLLHATRILTAFLQMNCHGETGAPLSDRR